MNSRGFRSQLDVFLGPKLNFNQSLSNVTIYAYTINLKSKTATSGYQLFPTFFAFSESAHQTEWENAQGAMKSRKTPKMGHPSILSNSGSFLKFFHEVVLLTIIYLKAVLDSLVNVDYCSQYGPNT